MPRRKGDSMAAIMRDAAINAKDRERIEQRRRAVIEEQSPAIGVAMISAFPYMPTDNRPMSKFCKNLAALVDAHIEEFEGMFGDRPVWMNPECPRRTGAAGTKLVEPAVDDGPKVLAEGPVQFRSEPEDVSTDGEDDEASHMDGAADGEGIAEDD